VATLTLLSGGFQLAVAVSLDLLLTSRQHVLRRDMAGGTVQADVVVMLHLDPRPDDVHLPATAAFPAEYTRFSTMG
jgi:hypothetical protein